ncbi:uncharacterized protein LOC124672096 [Lolium rigidum]|uniref:uncharacterized protein LOC124672096 n=1 Tax=Lolium rigidum TaxID=89674 RepID=UPI001F5C591F|nr:uncharacterized protein LOC124672096 [Lolium rigidum]
MPQLDLVSLFRLVDAGEPRPKLACETTAVAASYPDGRAESLRVSWAWSGRAGAVLERGGSTKGSSNPKAAAEAEARKGAPKPRRPPGPPAIVIGVLPAGKMAVQQRRPPVLGRGWRRPAGGARVFASEAVEAEEPSSPKVSCFGAVRAESRAAAHAPAPAPRGEDEQLAEERSGCWASVAASLRGICRSDNREEGELPASESEATASESPTTAAVVSPPLPIPGLGDVKRLASRRWPEGMAGLER